MYLKFLQRNNVTFAILFLHIVVASYLSFGSFGGDKCTLVVAICKQWLVGRRVAVPAHLRCRGNGVKLNTIANLEINNDSNYADKPTTGNSQAIHCINTFLNENYLFNDNRKI